MTSHLPYKGLSLALLALLVSSSSAAEIQNLVKRAEAAATPKKSFIEAHFQNEHHIQTFDLASFFSLHDLNRDGILDRSEIEAIYGVHHSLSVKHSANYETHDAKADLIVNAVLASLDKNKDGLITKSEFIAGGKDGLPSFPEFGENALGHHYDEESEFFMHHEEIYHNTPESQKAEAYTHPEDHEHFAHHQEIEDEEERRERKAEGMPTMEEDERLKKEAKAKGEKYVSPYEAQIPVKGSTPPVHEGWDAHEGGGAASEAEAGAQHVFRGPSGAHVVKTSEEQAINAQQAVLEHDLKPDRLEGETDHGYEDRLKAAKEAYEFKHAMYNNQVANTGKGRGTVQLSKLADETDEQYERRIARAKFDAAKSRPGMAPPSSGKGQAPNKYPPIGGKRKKGSFFGEF
ncbi:hypothetical protein BCV69DRAFT_282094 [Microstroma glucosiphilum]|uniref:EF-hand domain-containing protein n=1 Tax=Pseudomicrostroma glucosiphilum TaxID=1684307 RepID=A0A316U7Y8_9BASI|nr:hypothetical protein BCV69DRAFT_282094 [Pseudomicrostroma glucosiphilum]PWN21360.1 hypothetical protein BCV69DRAFT_282094 [Pseudomicrostroma glucosiphilum]